MPIVMPGLAPVVFSVTQIYPVFMIGFVLPLPMEVEFCML